ncbi:MAG: DEAD/DEAH box helicase family protein [candidate division WOR-3 bacterium]|uniref:DEAD/DEAH box helicase n=1 Tax=candidate division WOR-3 bacterium TaxID=2052148 RepID=A0A7C1SCW6_UNCW3|nr:DEAD/DEAH box helicase family protein [candidate division WOR-3 bacterium]
MSDFLTEADTRAKLIDPVLHQKGWTEDLIRREERPGGIEVIDGKPRKKGQGRTDYILRIRVNIASQPVAVALLEAKRSSEPPDKGLEQAKSYARLNNVPFIYSTNGYQFVEYDSFTGLTSAPRLMADFPTPAELRQRYEKGMGFSLEDERARPLLVSYPGGEASRRYYQDAAVRSVLEKIAQGRKRLLLSLATGSGKTFIAVHILKKIADAGQLRRALFVCDRDELRTQALSAFQNVFGADAAEVTTSNPQKNARILIATYQTLNVAGETDDAKFFMENYPENYFSHIVIDECHRSAWGKWSIILKRNPEAVQIGLTATPRYWEGGNEEERKQDEEITANNLQYFGEPVYEYDMAQGIEDGYLPACEIVVREINLDLSGISQEDIEGKEARDAFTGEQVSADETRPYYTAPTFEDKIQLPDRVKAMCRDLFEMLLQTGGPYQKTVIFCVRDSHADAVAAEMNNLYAEWCVRNNEKRLEPYAFKCTAAAEGSKYIADLRGSERSHFIATTVDLITTGVDVPILRNVVFFKYVRSPIAFHQMLGRGSRIHLPTNKLMFRVYDYTNATRLLGKPFSVRHYPSRERESRDEHEKERVIRVEGFDVHINPAGTYIVTRDKDGMKKVTVEEYRQMVAERLKQEAPTLDTLRELWIEPQKRRNLIDKLPDDGAGLRLLRELMARKDYDLYDILAEIAYGMAPKTLQERVDALEYKHRDWLNRLSSQARETLLAIARQFIHGGTEELENRRIFDILRKEGFNVDALKEIGEPREIITEAKRRLFAA